MTLKPRNAQHKNANSHLQSKSDALRQKRLAHEEAQKVAGVWGDMSVGTIKRDDHRLFCSIWARRRSWRSPRTAKLTLLRAQILGSDLKSPEQP